MKYFFGIDDEQFIRGKVPMTKQEIRIMTLAKARIASNAVIFDIGAGTGALSIEAARQASAGHVYAIERNPEGVQLIQQNKAKFAAANLTVLSAEAPEGICGLPACDVVLIGGSGHRLTAILDAVDKKLCEGGRIVLNCITVQTLFTCIEYMRSRKDYDYEAVQLQVNRLEKLGSYDMAKAINPIYIVTCTKKMKLEE